MTKQVLFAKEARDKLLEGVKKITDAVKVTMGASGKCVLIGEAIYGNDGMIQLPTIITKDGFNVTRHFTLPDPIENRGALIIKEAAMKTVEMAGDATTCTCVLAEAIISEGMKLIDEGANSQELKKGIEKGVEDAVAELKKISISVSDDNKKIFNVATVSANNDQAIGRLIADAFAKIGNDGMIDIVESKGMETEIKINEGHKIEKGWVSPFFVNNKAKETCEFDNPLILLYEKRITHHTQIQRGLELSMQAQRPLLIICEDADDEGLAFLTMNTLQGRVKTCVVKSPFGTQRNERMEDIAAVTGGTYISDSKGVGIKEIELENLGQAKKVIVSKEETVIIGGHKHLTIFDKLVSDLRENLKEAKTEDDRYPIEKRIARLTGGVAVIHVGAATETELKEKLDRVDDSVRATKSAIAEGIVAGGGTAFIRVASAILISPVGKESDFEKGQILIASILSKPLVQMAINAGVNAVDVYEKVLNERGNFGYNTKTGYIEDLIESGIIDSTKALRCALINAASISGMLLTSECLIETIF